MEAHASYVTAVLRTWSHMAYSRRKKKGHTESESVSE